jgi:phage terminase small subunit
MILFSYNYIVDFNATNAVLQVGYKASCANQIASNLLARGDITELIDKLVHERKTRIQIDADYVVNKLKRWAEADPFLYINESGCIKNIKDFPPELRDCVQNIQKMKDGTFKLTLVDKKGSLELLGRHIGAFTDNINLQATISLDTLILQKREEFKKKQLLLPR